MLSNGCFRVYGRWRPKSLSCRIQSKAAQAAQLGVVPTHASRNAATARRVWGLGVLMGEQKRKPPEPAGASSGEKPAPVEREEGVGAGEETLEEAARRDVRSVLAKALLNTAHLYEQAAYLLGRK